MVQATEAVLTNTQQSRTGTLKLAHVQIFGAFALALGVIALMARMHPYQVVSCPLSYCIDAYKADSEICTQPDTDLTFSMTTL